MNWRDFGNVLAAVCGASLVLLAMTVDFQAPGPRPAAVAAPPVASLATLPPRPLSPLISLPSSMDYTEGWREVARVPHDPTTKKQTWRVPAELVKPGACFYITAVDKSGNESRPSYPICLIRREDFDPNE